MRETSFLQNCLSLIIVSCLSGFPICQERYMNLCETGVRSLLLGPLVGSVVVGLVTSPYIVRLDGDPVSGVINRHVVEGRVIRLKINITSVAGTLCVCGTSKGLPLSVRSIR